MVKNNNKKAVKAEAKRLKKDAKAASLSAKKSQKLMVIPKPESKLVLREKISQKLPSNKKNLPKLTDETVKEYREKILAGGRKFKYPIQVSKHKILLVSLAAVLLAFLIFSGSVYFMLYEKQSTNDFSYDVARVVPLPVAVVDGENVKYGDYLRRIRADIFYYTNLENNDFSGEQGEAELNYNKRKELDAAIKSAYAGKIAREKGIKIEKQEVIDTINAQLKANNTDEAALKRTLKTYYDWSIDEYRDMIYSQLLVQRVSFEVDSSAKSKAESIHKKAMDGEDFANLITEYSDDANNGTISGKLTENNPLFAVAKNMEVGAISQPTEYINSDGVMSYAIIKLESKDENNVKISLIQINLTQFNEDFAKIQKDGKIKENIDIPRNN